MGILSICSGIGGLDLAVEAALDAPTLYHAEIDPHANAVLARHWPDVPNLGDLKRIDWRELDGVTAIIAGYPCQPFSNAGRRRGVDDPRHLWPWIARAIHDLRPPLVVLENVSGHRRLGLDVVAEDLARMGYMGRWGSVRASDAGAPHRRERLFIVAAPTDGHGFRLPRLEEVDRQKGPLDLDGRHNPHRRRMDRQRPSSRPATPDPSSQRRPARPRPRQGQPRGIGSGRPHDLHGEGGAAQLSLGNGAPREGRRFPWGKYQPAIDRWVAILGRPDPPGVTLRGALNPAFVEWMMGFPEGWVDLLDRRSALHALGNAVVPQAAALALDLLLDPKDPAA
jgi:DNA (cytosine-5)-methyltransferase 1